eukprot:TRINITY_DN17774_c0_g1_i2.p1 TRINITY_DN17774_c0_g1~~TRINITY_DN17774_c0_g1_i2.p1  ORF type:complete len:1815 (+),score=527.78 TRINITY_DN17774_c0_g1_i2:108-5552(+)
MPPPRRRLLCLSVLSCVAAAAAPPGVPAAPPLLRSRPRGDGVVRLSSGLIDTRRGAAARRRPLPLGADADGGGAEEEARDHYLLLLRQSAPPRADAALRSHFAAAAVHYVPHDAWVVYARPHELRAFPHPDWVEWWDRLPSANRVDPALGDQLGGGAECAEGSEHSGTGGGWRDLIVVSAGRELPPPRRPAPEDWLPDESGDGSSRYAPGAWLPEAAERARVWRLLLEAAGVAVAAAHPVAPARTLVRCGAEQLRQCVAQLSAQPEVSWVAPAQRPAPLSVTTQWIVQSGVPESRPAWDHGIYGDGEIVAVGDTGLDYAGCFFHDPLEPISYFPNISSTHRKIVSLSISDCECVENGAPAHGLPAPTGDDADQVNGHGTWAAGIIAGLASQHPRYSGLAPNARLFIQDLQDDLLPTALLRQLFPGNQLDARYFPQAYAAGARIQSSSWGTAPPPSLDDLDVPAMGGVGPRRAAAYGLYALDADRFAWQHQDMLLVFGAGNEGRRGARTIATPGNAKNVLTVGSLEVTAGGAQRQNVAYYSSTGPTFDGRVKPDVLAPSSDVVSAHSDGPAGNNEQCSLTAHSGTSVSTPIVAASAALLRQYIREGWTYTGRRQLDRGLSPPPAALLKAMLVASAEAIGGRKKLDFDDPVGTWVNLTRPSWIAGHGPINLANVMMFDKPAAPGMPPYDMFYDVGFKFHNSSAAGDWYTWCWEVRDTGDKRPLRVALAWPDYPASLFASTALVTDLDLTVISDAGRIWKGNGELFANYDDLNTVEAVDVPLAVPGRYQAFVSLKQPLLDAVRGSGAQPFALVVAGAITQNDAGYCPVRGCPGQCSGNGQCVSKTALVGSGGRQGRVRVCSCASNNTGVDCSIPPCATPAPECSGHGCYTAPPAGSQAPGSCLCYSDSRAGFWAGSTCSSCQTTHQGTGPGGSVNSCRIDKFCSYHGNLVGNSLGNGTCACQAAPQTGYWSGINCDLCRPGYHGLFCKCATADCDARGTCGDDGCVCYDDDVAGHWSHHGYFTNCTNCKTGWYGEDCKCSHPTCSGHGSCNIGGCVCLSNSEVGRWAWHNYTCDVCVQGWEGPGCNCRSGATADAVCGGHGTCGSALGCECIGSSVFGYWACSDAACTQGECSQCAPGWHGPACRCSDPQCGGHGTCTDAGCACDSDPRNGRWDVLAGSCTICAAGWYGPGCKCRSSDCDGHGACTLDGCVCVQATAHADPLLQGFFAGDGSRCDSCSPGWLAYPSCLCASHNCNGHGRCTLGGCDCFNNTTPGQGTWASAAGQTDCSVCAEGFSGADCLCHSEICHEVRSGPTAVSARVNFANYTHGNSTFLTGFDFAAEADALAPPGTEVVSTFKVVSPGPQHPRALTAPQQVYLELAFEWELQSVALQLTAAPTTPPVAAAPANATGAPVAAAPAGNGSARRAGALQGTAPAQQLFVFPSYATFRLFIVKNHSQDRILPSTTHLMVQGSGGWSLAADTCAATDRFEQVTFPADSQSTSDAQEFMLTARVCRASSGDTYAVYATKFVPDYSVYTYIVAAGIILVLLVVALILLHRFWRRLRLEKRQREAKENVIKFMQERKNDGPSLRERLGLGPDDIFTPEIAAQVIASKLKRRRKMFERLMNREEFRKIKMLTKAMVGIELTGRSADNVAALSQLTDGDKAVRKIWEFRDDELNLLEACRIVRGMFPKEDNPLAEEVVLKPGALPKMQQALVESQAENVKLRRLLLAMRRKEDDPHRGYQRPMQAELPSDPLPHGRQASVAPAVLREVVRAEAPASASPPPPPSSRYGQGVGAAEAAAPPPSSFGPLRPPPPP